MNKAVAYFRVSTAAQGRSGLGLEAQRHAVMALADRSTFNILAEFTEIESGKRDGRPELRKAFHHAKVTGAVLVIAKLDRLSRNAAFLLSLRDSGVRFVAADLPDANDLTIGLLAVVAQAEREAISRRTKEALAAISGRIKSGEGHSSVRSGRAVLRLGNPQRNRPFVRAGKGTAAALRKLKSTADGRAQDLTAIIRGLENQGIKSSCGLASAMNRMGVVTARGGRWHASTIQNLKARISDQFSPVL